jgi:hypothetical protein
VAAHLFLNLLLELVLHFLGALRALNVRLDKLQELKNIYIILVLGFSLLLSRWMDMVFRSQSKTSSCVRLLAIIIHNRRGLRLQSIW